MNIKNKQIGKNCTYSRPTFSNLSNAIVKIVVLLILFEYKARELNQVWYALNAFFFKLWLGFSLVSTGLSVNIKYLSLKNSFENEDFYPKFTLILTKAKFVVVPLKLIYLNL